MEIKKNWTEEKGLILTIALLSIIVVALFAYVYMPKSTGVKQYSVEVIEISGNCEDCFDIKSLADTIIKENNIKVKSKKTLDYTSQESKEIVNKYNIKTIPALVVLSRDIEKIGIDEKIFSIKNDYALFDKSVPYIDLETNEVRGVVKLIEIKTDNCMECTPLSQMQTQFEKLGVKIKDYETVSSSSERGKELIGNNNLTFTPALLVSEDIEEYWWLFDQLKNSFLKRGDYFLFKNSIAPYVDLASGKIKGKVDIIFLENNSCEECFNVTELKGSFQSLGIYFENEKSVDISSNEGKNLLKKYNITAIPTVILSKEIQDYEAIKKILEQIGTFENDEKFVFRKLDSLNVNYQDLG